LNEVFEYCRLRLYRSITTEYKMSSETIYQITKETVNPSNVWIRTIYSPTH
jgi:hypothetical protein